MYDKIDVNGDNAHVLFKWLKEKLHGFMTNSIKWNFTKFISDRNGVPIRRLGPKDPPNDLIPDIEKLLAEKADQ